MSNSDRADLLAFAWGRRRLPPNNSNLRLKIELLSGRGDESLPEAHTCFFAIDLPKYSCEEVMHSKLLYAIRNCSAIDNDFAVQSEILFDAESELLSLSDGIELQDGANDSQGLYEEVQEKDFAARKSSQLDIPLDGGHEISICASDHVESDFLRHKQAYKFMDMAEAKIGSKVSCSPASVLILSGTPFLVTRTHSLLQLAGQAAHGRHPAAGAADQEDADEVDRMWNDNDSFNLDESTSDSDSSSPSQQSQTIELHVEDEDESGDTMEDYSEEEDDSDADPVTTEDEDDSEDDGDDEDGDDDDPGYSEESDGDQDQMEIDLLPQHPARPVVLLVALASPVSACALLPHVHLLHHKLDLCMAAQIVQRAAATPSPLPGGSGSSLREQSGRRAAGGSSGEPEAIVGKGTGALGAEEGEGVEEAETLALHQPETCDCATPGGSGGAVKQKLRAGQEKSRRGRRGRAGEQEQERGRRGRAGGRKERKSRRGRSSGEG
eukprot:759541-Hanusia_phi.AAC.1